MVQRNLKWMFVLLAAFAVLSISVSTAFCHRIVATYTDSVRANGNWKELFGSLGGLSHLAAQANAPGNDIFRSMAPAAERARLIEAHQKFESAANDTRQRLEESLVPEDRSVVFADLDATERAVRQMVSEAEKVFVSFERGEVQVAGIHMATMDKEFARANESLRRLNAHLQEIVGRDLAAELRTAQRARTYEYLIGGTILLLVIAATIYAKRLSDKLSAIARQERENCLLRKEQLEQRRRLEAQAFLHEKLATLGMLAAGIAHEINNPLAYILANAEFIARSHCECLEARQGNPSAGRNSSGLDLGRCKEVMEAIAEVCQGANRVRLIVRDLKAFSRADDEKVEAVDLSKVLESCLRVAASEIRGRAVVRKNFGKTSPVTANEYRLSQVFLNLLINAAQAIIEGGKDSNEICISTSLDSSGRAVVEVRDTGAGIPAAIRDRIFDPFFTTKPIGVGTGLGLSICHAIVSGLGGEISFETELGKGTLFKVALPAACGEEPAELAPTQHSSACARVLVIDDEAEVGNAIRRLLSAEHTVEVLTGGQAALNRLAAGDQFDLILCDLMMPQMTGMDFFAQLEKVSRAHQGRTVFLTGGAFTPDARAFLEQVPNTRLDKPFDASVLLSLVAASAGRRMARSDNWAQAFAVRRGPLPPAS